MINISILSQLTDGANKNVDVSQNVLVVNTLKVGGIAGTDLTKSIVDSLILSDGSRAMAANLDLGNFNIVNVLDPVNPQDVATKAYVDTAAGSGANTSLSNLSAVEVNAPISTTDQTSNFGVVSPDLVLNTGNTFFAVPGKIILQSGMDTNDSSQGQISLIGSVINLTGTVDMSSHQINNMGDPFSAQDAATKNYVDTKVSAINRIVSAVDVRITATDIKLLNTTGTTVPGQFSQLDDSDQASTNGNPNSYLSQNFTATETIIVSAVTFKVGRGAATTGTFRVIIIPGTPNGNPDASTVLAQSADFNVSTVGLSSGGGSVVTYTLLSPVTLVEGETYGIALDISNATAGTMSLAMSTGSSIPDQLRTQTAGGGWFPASGDAYMVLDYTKYVADPMKISNLADPTNPQDAATKAYVDTAVTAPPDFTSIVIPNNVSLSWRNSLNNADIPVLKLSDIDFVELGKTSQNIGIGNIFSSTHAYIGLFEDIEINTAANAGQITTYASSFNLIGASTGADSQAKLKFWDGNGSKWLALTAPDVIPANFTLKLPTNAGSDGQFLQVDASGQLSFADGGSVDFTSIASNVVPDAGSTRFLGSFAKTWLYGYMDNVVSQIVSVGTDTSNNKFALRGDAGLSMYSGHSIGAGILPFDGVNNFGIQTGQNGVANSNPSPSLYFETGNKVAGTGDSGNIELKTGTSSGGARGKIKLDASEIDFFGNLDIGGNEIINPLTIHNTPYDVAIDFSSTRLDLYSVGVGHDLTIGAGDGMGNASGALFGPTGIQLNGAKLTLPTAASDPSTSVVEGDTYYNTVSHKIRWYDGTTWADLGGGGGGLTTGTNLVAGDFDLKAGAGGDGTIGLVGNTFNFDAQPDAGNIYLGKSGLDFTGTAFFIQTQSTAVSGQRSSALTIVTGSTSDALPGDLNLGTGSDGSSNYGNINFYADKLIFDNWTWTKNAAGHDFDPSFKFFGYDAPAANILFGSGDVPSGNTTQASSIIGLTTGSVLDAASAQNSGSLSIQSGAAYGSGKSGDLLMGTGYSETGLIGEVQIFTSVNGSNNRSGNITLVTGASGSNRGKVRLDGLFVESASKILPDTTDSYDLGSGSKRWGDAYVNNVRGSALVVSVMANSLTTPSGQSATGIFGTTDFVLYTNNNGTADANPTSTLYLESGNKTAGTGNSGNIKLTTGTSAGGSRGKISLDALTVQLPKGTSDPAGVEGDVYYNTSTHKMMLYDGTSWVALN